MKRKQILVATTCLVVFFVAIGTDASAQQQPVKKPAATSPAQPTLKPASPATVRPVAQQPKEKPKEKKTLADAVVPTRPERRLSSYPPLNVVKKLGGAYEATVASKLDALNQQHADDVAVIKSAFKRLQTTKDSKEADRLVVKLSQLLTDVNDPSKEESTLDEKKIASVARELRLLEGQRQK